MHSYQTSRVYELDIDLEHSPKILTREEKATQAFYPILPVFSLSVVCLHACFDLAYIFTHG